MEKRHLVLIVPLILVTSCQQEMDVPDQFKAPDITAEIQGDTRTALSVDEYGAGTIYWKPADQIDVFIGESKLVYTSQNSSNVATATFKTNDGLGGNYPDSEPLLAIYPSYGESYINEWGDRLVCSYLPSRQYGLPGTFDDDLFMAVATGTKQNMGSNTPLSFHNICSGLKFSLSRDDITCVKFRGTDSSNGAPVVLAGDVFFEFDGSWSGSSSGATEITLYPKSGGTFQKDAYYYIICFPASLRDFYVDFETTSGASATLRGIEYNQARGVLIDEPFEFRKSIFMKKTHIDEYAKFSDEDVPHTQIKYWTSGRPDSIWQNAPEGGYYEWFGVEPFQNESVFDKNDGIGYGEFRFNSPVTRIGPSLFKNSNLTQIHLPMSITEIGSSAFEGSSSLTYLSVPQSLTSIGSRAFYGCSSLESRSLYIPDSVTSIGSQAYENCLNLTSLEIPSSVTDIGVEAFGGCVGLASIIVDSSNPVFDSRENCNAIIRTDTNELVSGCKNTVIPNSVTKIGACAFYGCSGLASIEIPSSVSHIGISAFTYCTGLTSITVYADTPPQLDNHLVFSGTNNCPIYVPAGSVAAYKSAWSEYADRIRPNVEAVDLGLPSGVKWAAFNVGASSPEGYGDYFAWGETEPKSNYSMSTYVWCNGTGQTFTKYSIKSSYGHNGFTDNKTVLDLEDDAAHVNWGGSWRMPTDAEWTELRNNCTWTWTTQNGVNGYRVTSNKTGYTYKSIFLPAAGGWIDTSLYDVGTEGNYWSSSLSTDTPDCAWDIYFKYGSVDRYYSGRSYGFSVRPVYGDFISVESISLNKSSLSIIEGETSQLSATVMPANATEKTVTWTSSNTSVATVSSAGVVTAVSAGTATITAWASDGSHSATCTVTVSQRVTDITISPDNATIYTGEQVALRAIVSPSSATNPGVSWSSSDSSIAFVSSDGTVLGVMAGTATITAQANDGSGITGTCVVTVKQHVTGVSIDSQSQVVMGGTRQLYVTISPSNASDRSVTWSSSNTSVAVVDANGVVSGIVNGTAIITATSVDGDFMASCELTVTLPTTPSHLSLVVSRSGDASSRYYLTKDQYNVADLSGYYKQGVCVLSSSYFIVYRQDLYTSATGSTANGAAIMPNEEQANWLISNMQTLNSALTSFGCTAMSTTANYWSSKKRGDRYYYYFKYNGSMVFDNSGSATARARPLVSL